jgi:predicted AlkP superfamily pyrophosphatase or phosphodiesterase
MRSLPALLAALLPAALLAAAPPPAGAADPPVAPRLVVEISIDQCRAEYLTRFADLYLPAGSNRAPGGFRYLLAKGAWYADCRYEHYRTVTAVGHSVIGTGAQPSESGIVGNTWFDRATGKSVYCTDDLDPNVKVVGALPGSKETPMSPAHQLVSTVGDELELATGGRARTVSISLKDRASILMAGRRGDAVIWFDEQTGGFVSSTPYCPSGKLPAWVQEFNALGRADALRREPWRPSVSDAALLRVWNPKGGVPTFKHDLTGKDYVPMTVSPRGTDLVLEAARRGVEAEGLGKDDIPDILTLNFASIDYVGHRFGPDSAEILDIMVQTDRQLAAFFKHLEETVTGGLRSTTIIVTSDHGVATVPEVNAASGLPVARAVASGLRAAAEKALDDAFGADDWVLSIENGEVYLSDAALAKRPEVTRPQAEARVVEAIRNLPGVHLAIGKTAVLTGQAPPTGVGRRLPPAVHPQRSGDVLVVLRPGWLAGAAPIGTGTSHGAPWPYDTHVPLLACGAGFRPGLYLERTAPSQIAPSLAFLLNCVRPSGADSDLLPGLAHPAAGG